ncbi:hypothetical protein Dda_3821 [Drechslerella dactyloides]|uniref:Uncharacterized protein n=1 Tax=Drechslerella dactyloides TaxID=74499 RepID=A0AAD6IYP0_DREDA|nr:hypothetical protein Dda_3821 [Drechslerella dactyloides]
MTSSPEASPSSALPGPSVPQLTINTSDAVTNGNNASNGNEAARRASQATGTEPSLTRPDMERADSQGPDPGDPAPMSAVSQTALLPTSSRELSERVFWNALLFESDLLAELDLPHSGIIPFEESIGLPCGFEMEDEDSPAGVRDDLWYFLAEIALRRLLNRVSHLIYSDVNRERSISTLGPIVGELDYQLTQWYESLPLALQFPHHRVQLNNPIQTVLRLRYFACRTIIFRPYIHAVLKDEKLGMDTVVRENCRKCLEACLRQLEHITEHHAGHMPYLWQGALSMVSQSLLVMGATMSPSLAAVLPPADNIDKMLKDVITELQHYAHLAPSLKLSLELVQEAEERRRYFLRESGMRL